VLLVDFLASDEAWGGAEGRESFIQGVRQLTAAIQETGARIGVQLWHSNRYPAFLAVRQEGERVGPSPRIGKTEWWEEEGEIRELTEAEIQDIVAKFGKAAAGARAAGFDFVEIHGAHAYLLNQFFSPRFNQRTDRYGGDLQGRMRLGLECVAAIRQQVGKDYPLFYRLGAWEDAPGGVTLEESIEFARALEAAGVDCLDISVARGIPDPSTPEGASPISPLKKAPMGTFAWIAAAIKQAVNIPVIAVGRVNSHKVAEEILQQGKADLIAIGRQLIADPFWVKKVAEGRFKEIVACDSCNRECYDPLRGGSLGCHLNPRAGREKEMPPSGRG
jgi:2,4-dienoyl-CoA reductase-like NADH-dependent reductase (Old Yellow Enzyme family)